MGICFHKHLDGRCCLPSCSNEPGRWELNTVETRSGRHYFCDECMEDKEDKIWKVIRTGRSVL